MRAWIVIAGLVLSGLITSSAADTGTQSAVDTVKEMIGAMISPTPVLETIVQRAYLSQDLRHFMGTHTGEQWRNFDADPILGTQDWTDWKLDSMVKHGDEVDVVFTVGKIRIQRDFVVVKDGSDWRIDNVVYHDGKKITNLRELLASKTVSATAQPQQLAPSPSAAIITSRYPWSIKSQSDLTQKECAAAMHHDRNFWWSKGTCHMKFIRYAAGVAIRDTHAIEDQASVRHKGELFQPTQYNPENNSYCEHGGYCYPAADIKLLGSIRTPPDRSHPTGDTDIDAYQGLVTSCEMLEEDRANIVSAGAQELFHDCQ